MFLRLGVAIGGQRQRKTNFAVQQAQYLWVVHIRDSFSPTLDAYKLCWDIIESFVSILLVTYLFPYVLMKLSFLLKCDMS